MMLYCGDIWTLLNLCLLSKKRSLFFARADKLDDPFEGFLPQRILEILRSTYSGNEDPKENIFLEYNASFQDSIRLHISLLLARESTRISRHVEIVFHEEERDCCQDHLCFFIQEF